MYPKEKKISKLILAVEGEKYTIICIIKGRQETDVKVTPLMHVNILYFLDDIYVFIKVRCNAVFCSVQYSNLAHFTDYLK